MTLQVVRYGLVTGLALLTVLVLIEAMASVYFLGAMTQLEQEGDVESAREQLAVALWLSPGNADNWLACARMPGPDRLDCARKAVWLRRVDPRAWIELALAKAEQGEFDEEFSSALDTGIRLGPREPGVQLGATLAGLTAWRALDAATRLHVEHIALEGLSSLSPGQASRMVPLVNNTPLEPRLCPKMMRNRTYRTLCSSK